MWIRVLGISKRLILGVMAAALFWGPGGLRPASGAEAPVAKPAPAPTHVEPEIIFNGKVFCSLKRRVDLPFKGTITSLRVHSGEKVNAGEILATYRLAPESLRAIHQRLAPPQIADEETKLAEVQRSLVPLRSKQRELTQLVKKEMAPSQSLSRVNQEIKFLEQEKTTLQDRLQKDRHLVQQDREVLENLLGTSLKSGKVPREVSLKSPINGYVIGVNPEIRFGAELTPMPGAFLVGVMNPMVVRAQAFEIEALQIKVGDKAQVTLDSLPGHKFQAKVSRISWSSITTAPDQPAYYEVELTVSNPDLLLKEGLKARIVLAKSK